MAAAVQSLETTSTTEHEAAFMEFVSGDSTQQPWMRRFSGNNTRLSSAEAKAGVPASSFAIAALADHRQGAIVQALMIRPVAPPAGPVKFSPRSRIRGIVRRLAIRL